PLGAAAPGTVSGSDAADGGLPAVEPGRPHADGEWRRGPFSVSRPGTGAFRQRAGSGAEAARTAGKESVAKGGVGPASGTHPGATEAALSRTGCTGVDDGDLAGRRAVARARAARRIFPPR